MALGVAWTFAGAGVRADEIHNPTAVFAGLDKITGRITRFDVAIDETVQFGTLQITPRVCLTRPQTETPLTEGFVEVDDIDAAKTAKRIFSGWMFAASPGLHGVEHPVYDVWLKDCVGGKDVTPSPVNAQADTSKAPPPNATPAPKPGTPAQKPRRTIEPQEPVEPTMENLPPTNPDDALPPDTAPPANLDDGLGPPVEVGPPPGARPPAMRGAEPVPSDDGFGPPVEVGPPPGASGRAEPGAPSGAPNAAAPNGAAPKPAKPKRKPPADPNAPLPPGDIPQSAPQPRQQQPSGGPQDLIKNLPFFH